MCQPNASAQYEDMYDDIKEALDDESDVVIFHARNTLSISEFIKNNMEVLKKQEWI